MNVRDRSFGCVLQRIYGRIKGESASSPRDHSMALSAGCGAGGEKARRLCGTSVSKYGLREIMGRAQIVVFSSGKKR